MKTTLRTLALATLFITGMSSCARFYGFKQPLAEREPVVPKKSNQTEQQKIQSEPEIVFNSDEKSIQEATVTPEFLAGADLLGAEVLQLSTTTLSPDITTQTISNEIQPSIAEKESILAAGEGDDRKMDGFAVAGFVVSLVGLLIFGYVFGAIAIIFSAISLARISKRKEELKGKGLAVAGLVIGIADIVLLAILMAAL